MSFVAGLVVRWEIEGGLDTCVYVVVLMAEGVVVEFKDALSREMRTAASAANPRSALVMV